MTLFPKILGLPLLANLPNIFAFIKNTPWLDKDAETFDQNLTQGWLHDLNGVHGFNPHQIPAFEFPGLPDCGPMNSNQLTASSPIYGQFMDRGIQDGHNLELYPPEDYYSFIQPNLHSLPDDTTLDSSQIGIHTAPKFTSMMVAREEANLDADNTIMENPFMSFSETFNSIDPFLHYSVCVNSPNGKFNSHCLKMVDPTVEISGQASTIQHETGDLHSFFSPEGQLYMLPKISTNLGYCRNDGASGLTQWMLPEDERKDMRDKEDAFHFHRTRKGNDSTIKGFLIDSLAFESRDNPSQPITESSRFSPIMSQKLLHKNVASGTDMTDPLLYKQRCLQNLLGDPKHFLDIDNLAHPVTSSLQEPETHVNKKLKSHHLDTEIMRLAPIHISPNQYDENYENPLSEIFHRAKPIIHLSHPPDDFTIPSHHPQEPDLESCTFFQPELNSDSMYGKEVEGRRTQKLSQTAMESVFETAKAKECFMGLRNQGKYVAELLIPFTDMDDVFNGLLSALKEKILNSGIQLKSGMVLNAVKVATSRITCIFLGILHLAHENPITLLCSQKWSRIQDYVSAGWSFLKGIFVRWRLIEFKGREHSLFDPQFHPDRYPEIDWSDDFNLLKYCVNLGFQHHLKVTPWEPLWYLVKRWFSYIPEPINPMKEEYNVAIEILHLYENVLLKSGPHPLLPIPRPTNNIHRTIGMNLRKRGEYIASNMYNKNNDSPMIQNSFRSPTKLQIEIQKMCRNLYWSLIGTIHLIHTDGERIFPYQRKHNFVDELDSIWVMLTDIFKPWNDFANHDEVVPQPVNSSSRAPAGLQWSTPVEALNYLLDPRNKTKLNEYVWYLSKEWIMVKHSLNIMGNLRSYKHMIVQCYSEI